MGRPLPTHFQEAIETFAEVLRYPAAQRLEQILSGGRLAGLPRDAAHGLAKLVAYSEFAAGIISKNPDRFATIVEAPDGPPDTAALEQLVALIGGQCDDFDEARAQIRQFRNWWLVHLLWREVSGVAKLEETLESLSELADRLLDAAAGLATRRVEERFGTVRDELGGTVPLVILGMGKLGGRELNFSSDIDIIFLYPDGVESDGRKRVSAQEYFTRVSRHVVALLDEVTEDGFAFRIDTRLRPFGDSGPPVTSFAALESYLVQHGRGWERYAYVKAHIVGPRPPAAVAGELIEGMIRPFVFRRYLDFGVFESLREMHGLVSAEVKRREMADNIKLGPGGIREIEFIVQSLQLVRGGSKPALQDRALLGVVPKLVGRHGLNDAESLARAYRFLRRLENFIQGIRDRQTHELPTSEVDRARLCLAMGYAGWSELIDELDSHRTLVSDAFHSIAFRGQEDDPAIPAPGELWDREASAADWTGVLDRVGLADAGAIAEILTAFAAAPAARHIDSVAAKRLRRFIPNLLERLRECDDAVTALKRVLAVVEKILRRSAYLAMLNENAQVLSRLVSLCERSSYIADQIARYPILLDELLDPSIGSSPLKLDELDAELDERLAECDADDGEAQISALGQFQRANLFRIAIADFAGRLPIMKVSDSLTWLAEAVLKHTLAIAWRDLACKYGEPEYVDDGERHKAGFAIVAYGKLGGLEMSYGSDLDLVFLHDSHGRDCNTSGPRTLDNTVFFTRLVRRLSHFLTAQTGTGMLYEVDTRLRPDGQSGVMVSSVEAFERYQEENAWTWEHQALLRARPVAGSEKVREEFMDIRAETLASRVRLDQLRNDVISMRRRMRDNLDKSSDSVFDLKQGSGGIGDIEFIVQYLVLANAGKDTSLYFYTDNIRQLEALAKAGFIAAGTADRLQKIYKRYRLRLHHLVLDEKTALVSADEFTADRHFVEELWKEVL